MYHHFPLASLSGLLLISLILHVLHSCMISSFPKLHPLWNQNHSGWMNSCRLGSTIPSSWMTCMHVFTHFRMPVRLLIVVLLVLTSGCCSTTLPTINATLCYGFATADALGEQSLLTLNIDGRDTDWLDECIAATRHLHYDIAQFICAQVSLGLLRRQRPVIHQ